jgi:tetratricopeptide (TPR) repeat protein
LRHNGDLKGAIQSFTAAVGINPGYLKALVRLAVALREAGDSRAAMEAARRALSIDPESIKLHYELGLMYADQREFSLALERFEYTLAAAPGSVDCIANIALALQNMGLLDRATETWRMLCDLAESAPQSHPMFHDLGRTTALPS